MKNILALTNLVMIVGYPLAALAQSLGLLPFELVSLSTFIGVFTALNLLAISLVSYGRQPTYGVRTSRPVVAAAPAAEPLHATWVCHTISA